MIPFARILFLALFTALPMASQEPTSSRVIDFDSGPEGEWVVINDGVMGGVSRSSIEPGEEAGTACFSGTLSLENNGGFASVRTPVPEGSFRGATSVRVRVRGDGQRYQLRLRPGRSWGGVSYAASFDTRDGEWIEVEMGWDELEPTYRGYRPRVGPLDPADVGQLGFMLTDKQVGSFQLEIAWVEVVVG